MSSAAGAGRWLFLAGVMLMVTGDGPSSTIGLSRWPTPFPFLSWEWLYLVLLSVGAVCFVAGGGVKSWTLPHLRFVVVPLVVLLGAFLLATVASQVHTLSVPAFLIVAGVVAASWVFAVLLEDERVRRALWPTLAIALVLPWAAGAVLLVVDGRRPTVGWAAVGILSLTLVALVALAVDVVDSAAVVVTTGDWEPGVGITLRADALGVVFAVLSTLVLLAATDGASLRAQNDSAATQLTFVPELSEANGQRVTFGGIRDRHPGAHVWLVRVQAAWCGTCLWHASWTPSTMRRPPPSRWRTAPPTCADASTDSASSYRTARDAR